MARFTCFHAGVLARAELRHVGAKRGKQLGIWFPTPRRGAPLIKLPRGALDQLGNGQVHVALGSGHLA
jgi:hypothetical protein